MFAEPEDPCLELRADSNAELHSDLTVDDLDHLRVMPSVCLRVRRPLLVQAELDVLNWKVEEDPE